MEFRVVWEIDVEANSRLEAAHKAREIQLDPTSIATVFRVHEGFSSVMVDLDDQCQELNKAVESVK